MQLFSVGEIYLINLLSIKKNLHFYHQNFVEIFFFNKEKKMIIVCITFQKKTLCFSLNDKKKSLKGRNTLEVTEVEKNH